MKDIQRTYQKKTFWWVENKLRMNVLTILSSEKLQNIWKKFICWWSECFPLKMLILSCCKNIKKVLHKKFIKGYNEHTTLERSCIKVYIRMIKILTLKTKVQNEIHNGFTNSPQRQHHVFHMLSHIQRAH